MYIIILSIIDIFMIFPCTYITHGVSTVIAQEGFPRFEPEPAGSVCGVCVFSPSGPPPVVHTPNAWRLQGSL